MLHIFLDKLPLNWTIKFALLRLLAQWRSLATVIVGVFLAATIGANIPLYTSAVSQIGMIERLERQPDEDIHIRVRITHRTQPDQTLSEFVDNLNTHFQQEIIQHFREPFGDWVIGTFLGVESTPLIPQTPLLFSEETGQQTRFRLAHHENWQQATRLVEGEYPSAMANSDDVLEVALNLLVANEMGLNIGDEITLVEANPQDSTPITVRVTGIVQELNLTDPYWITPSPLSVDRTERQIELTLQTTQSALLSTIENNLPNARTRIIWRTLFDYTQLTFEQSAQVMTALENFEDVITTELENSDTGSLSLVYENESIEVLEDYRQEIGQLNAPFALLLLQIGALVLLFLMVIVTLVRRGERREIAMLQSRGSYDSQILLIRGIEALIICGLATIISPFIARQILIVLVPALVNVDRLSLTLTPAVFVYASLASFTALVLLIISLRPVLKLPLISGGGSTTRSETQTWWQRYYLDILLMLFGIFGLWRLLNSNSALVETQSGIARADPLLLLTPALLFIAIGSLMLRFFPATMTFITRLIATRRGLGGLLAGWQISREPLHYSRITFLLALTIGIGWFATSFQATIIRSQSDQAHYRVGADLRISEFDTDLRVNRARPLEEIIAIEGVKSATSLARFDNIGVAVNTVSFQTGELLAIDHTTMNDVAFWRNDLGVLQAPTTEDTRELSLNAIGIPLPDETARIGLWAIMPQSYEIPEANAAFNTQLSELVAHTNISLRLIDERNTIFRVGLGITQVEGLPEELGLADLQITAEEISIERIQELSELVNTLSGWAYFEADLSNIEFEPFGSLRIVSVDLFKTNNFSLNDINNIHFSDMTVTDAGGNNNVTDILIDDRLTIFSGPQDSSQQDYTFSTQTAPGRPTQQSTTFEWVQNTQFFGASLLTNYPIDEINTLNAIVSNSFLELNNLEVGLEFSLNLGEQELNFEIIDSVNYYPTMYQEERPFIIVDLATLQVIANQNTNLTVFENETWIRLNDNVSESDIIQALQRDTDRYQIESTMTFNETITNLETDPLSLGLIGLLFLSFVIVMVLSIISMLTYAGLTAQFRRAEFGVLRALGVSTSRLIFSMALEQIIVTTVAVIIGVIIGFVLSTQVLPTLATIITTQTVAPPFIVQTETSALLQYSLVIAGILIVVVLFTLILIRQLSLAQAIRLGEE